MVKYLVTSVLVFLFAANVAACDKTEHDVVVPVNEPVEFTVLVKNLKGDTVRLFSERKFVVGNGYEGHFQNEEVRYLLRISPGGKNVVFKYKFHGMEPKILTGRYEYIPYSLNRCQSSPLGNKWVFVQDR